MLGTARVTWLPVVVVLGLACLGASKATPAKRPKQSKITLDTGRPTSPFDCDTAKAKAWYGSEQRCHEDLCRGRNESNAYVSGPDGRLRANPCDHRLRR